MTVKLIAPTASERKPVKVQELESLKDLGALIKGDIVNLDNGLFTIPRCSDEGRKLCKLLQREGLAA